MNKLKTFDTLEKAVVELKTFINRGSYNCDAPKTPNAIYPARYDHAPINNMARQISEKIGLTDRQQELAITLITKYHKQWKKQGYDVSNISLDTPTDIPIRRNLDRSKSVSASGNLIHLKFPYIPRLMQQIAEFATKSCGSITFDNKAKVWNFAATAGNTVWTDKFASDHKFAIDPSYALLSEAMDEAYDYKSIQLDIVDGELVLNNAPVSMLDWIADNLGDVSMVNFVTIVSSAQMLAFTLSNDVIDYTFDNYPHLADIILQRKSFINSDETTFEEMLHKVRRLNYNNIVLFVTDGSSILEYTKAIMHAMPEYNVSSKQHDILTDSSKKIYLTSRVMAIPVDIIISTAGFMAGPSRKNWFNTAIKNIYYCQDIDNKIKKTIKKDESNLNYKRRNKR